MAADLVLLHEALPPRGVRRITIKRCLDGFAMLAETANRSIPAFLTANTDLHPLARYLRDEYRCDVHVRLGPRTVPRYYVWKYGTALTDAQKRNLVKRARKLLSQMTPEQRGETFSGYCQHCFGDRLPCHCVRDE